MSLGPAAFLALALAGQAASPPAPPAVEPAGAPLSLEQAVREAVLLACVPTALGLLDPGAESETLAQAGILGGFPIEARTAGYVSTLKQFPAASLHHRPAKDGKVLIGASAAIKACRVAVFDVPAARARSAVLAEFKGRDVPWRSVEETNTGGIQMQTFVWNIDGKNRVTANVSYPRVSPTDRGLQAMVTVARTRN